ncbi:MAG: hypothetical protein HY321_13700 [Armatimonadetes bacterium]|nr:hypothetical protein [Armatimonadota bacterium]
MKRLLAVGGLLAASMVVTYSTRRAVASASLAPLAIAYTNDTRGFLESCGCSKSVLGGLPRRAGLLRSLRKRHPNLVVVDSGNLGEGDAHLDVSLRAMSLMGYQAVGMGLAEVLGGNRCIRIAEKRKVPLVNTLVPNGKRGGYPREWYSVVTRGWRVAIVGFSPSEHYDADALRHRLRVLLPRLRQQHDLVVALSQLGMARDRQIAEWQGERDWLDFIIGGRDAAQLAEPLRVKRTTILPTSDFGREVGLLTVRRVERELRWECRRLPVDGACQADAVVQGLVDDLRRSEAEKLEEARRQETQGLRGLAGRLRVEWVTAAQCGVCKKRAYGAWLKHPHSRALRTLEEKGRVVPECLPCHSQTFRAAGRSPEKGADDGVQCVICHTGGVLHRMMPRTKRIKRDIGESVCRSCHDSKHDPDFDVKTRMERLRHWQER